MIYVDMPLDPVLVLLIAAYAVMVTGIYAFGTVWFFKTHDPDRYRNLVDSVPILFTIVGAVVGGAVVYSGILYDPLVHGATMDAIHDAGYENVTLTGDYFTAMQGDNQVTAGLIPTGPDSYRIEVFMSGPTTIEE